jgi:RNA polymerase sigma-54 factor
MSLEMAPRQRLEQRMHLSQQMLQNLELLLMPAMDLQDFVRKEIEQNPVLEEGEEREESPIPAGEEEESAEEATREEMLAKVEDEWLESERRTRRKESGEDAERRMEMLNNTSAPAISLKEHLSNQLLLLELPDDLRTHCAHVVEHGQDSGLLKASVEDMMTSLPRSLLEGSLETVATRLENAIAVIQSLDPRGVGARSIQECLMLQIDPADAMAPVLRRFIENHLDDIGANRLPPIVRTVMSDPVLMKDLGREEEVDPAVILGDVKQLIAEIAKLSPSPGATYAAAKPSRVVPEVVIRRVDGVLEIVLEEGWLPAISINRNYEALIQDRVLSPDERATAGRMAQNARFARADRTRFARLAAGKRVHPIDRTRAAELSRGASLPSEEAGLLAAIARDPACSKNERDFLKPKVAAGRKLIAAIEQRRGTIYRITEQIVRRQSAFFEGGIEHLRPLRMQEVADALGVHLSTVSRAVSDKWMETPHGILPFRFFFASAAPQAEAAGPGTRLALLEKVRDILEAEDKTHPHSDLEIARLLNQNYHIPAARRTVAKYREELRFRSASLRKAY